MIRFIKKCIYGRRVRTGQARTFRGPRGLRPPFTYTYPAKVYTYHFSTASIFNSDDTRTTKNIVFGSIKIVYLPKKKLSKMLPPEDLQRKNNIISF